LKIRLKSNGPAPLTQSKVFFLDTKIFIFSSIFKAHSFYGASPLHFLSSISELFLFWWASTKSRLNPLFSTYFFFSLIISENLKGDFNWQMLCLSDNLMLFVPPLNRSQNIVHIINDDEIKVENYTDWSGDNMTVNFKLYVRMENKFAYNMFYVICKYLSILQLWNVPDFILSH